MPPSTALNLTIARSISKSREVDISNNKFIADISHHDSSLSGWRGISDLQHVAVMMCK